MKSLVMQAINHTSSKHIELIEEQMTVERIGFERFLLTDGFWFRIFLDR